MAEKEGYASEQELDKKRRILDAFHSRNASRYIEILRNLPKTQHPDSGPRLVQDYINGSDMD